MAPHDGTPREVDLRDSDLCDGDLRDGDLRLVAVHRAGETVWRYEMRLGERLAGIIRLRLSLTPAEERELGTIGYHVFPFYRGRRLSERACRLLIPVIAGAGRASVLITCDAGNAASRRICERLGAEHIASIPTEPDAASPATRLLFRLPIAAPSRRRATG